MIAGTGCVLLVLLSPGNREATTVKWYLSRMGSTCYEVSRTCRRCGCCDRGRLSSMDHASAMLLAYFVSICTVCTLERVASSAQKSGNDVQGRFDVAAAAHPVRWVQNRSRCTTIWFAFLNAFQPLQSLCEHGQERARRISKSSKGSLGSLLTWRRLDDGTGRRPPRR